MDSAFEWYLGQALAGLNRHLAELVSSCLTYPTLSKERQSEYKMTVINYKLSVIVREVEVRLRTVHEITASETRKEYDHDK